MTNLFFPDLNLAYDFVKQPYYSTRISTSVSGMELRASLQSQPKFELTLSLPVLSQRNLDNEFQTLEKFFHKMKGSYQSFLLEMLDDNSFEYIIRGDGVRSVYQVIKDEMILSNVNPQGWQNANPLMWHDDSSTLMWKEDSSALMWTTDLTFVLSEKGIITFNRVLLPSESVKIPIKYYYRCRFSEDSQQFTLFAHKLWKGEVNLVASLGAHI